MYFSSLDSERACGWRSDVTKHAVLGKFNEIRPGMYREYMKDVCEKVHALGDACSYCNVLE